MTVTALRDESNAPLPGMVGNHQTMRDAYRLVRRVAPSDVPVVIEGETGTGKELVARALHRLSGLTGSLVDINCAALPEHLLESELFGSEAGGFTGAVRREGLLESADGGTLFLDEAASLGLACQAKLLRAVEHHGHRRVGGRQLIDSRFRLIVAVSRPVRELVGSGAWRSDFAYRIAGVTVELPNLRSRLSDLPLLTQWFTERECPEGARPRWEESAAEALRHLAWQGNVRELEMLVRRIMVLRESDAITALDVAAAVVGMADDLSPSRVAAVVASVSGNISQAARALGVSRATVRSRLSECQ